MSNANKAVFLSYASQDADAVRQIAEALRGHGVEVWFDQNELVGGDAWDAKIRGQIASCALFVPVISAATQARLEGYFRIEWKLAAQRTHAMAEEKAFLLPIVIDETRDAAAHVPAEFRAVQWTRMAGGEGAAVEKFCSRVRRLLGGEGRDASPRRPPAESDPRHGRPGETSLPAKASRPWRVPAILGVSVVAGLAIWRPWRETAPPQLAPTSASSKLGNPASAPVANEKSLVVLPLENLSPDPENAFFTDGMHAEIIATLQAVPELKVISREAALALKRDGGAVEAGRRAGVAHVLAGSVRREGSKVRVLLDLRRVSDDALLWSAPKVTRELKEALALQAEVAEEVARVLRARFDKGTFAGLRFLAADPRAYDSYLKAYAQYQSNVNNPASILKAVALMKEGMTFDAQFMPGARLLGRMYVRAAAIESNPNAAWGFAAEAKKWSELASRLTPGGAGDSSLAYYYGSVEHDPVRALAYAENAVRALPNDFEGHHYVGLALRGMGRTHEALVHMERSIALDPLNSPSWAAAIETRAYLRQVKECLNWLEKYRQVNPEKFQQAGVIGWRFCLDGSLPATLDDAVTMFARQTWLWRSRRFEELAQLVERLPVAPDPVNHNNLSRLLRRCDALRWLGREPEAMAVAREVARVVERMNALPDRDVSGKARRLALARSRLGEFDAAIAAARRAVEAREGPGVMWRWAEEVSLAEIYAYARRPRECAEVLAKLLRVPSGLTVPMLKADPIWDHVRDDPAIQALMADPKNSAPL